MQTKTFSVYESVSMIRVVALGLWPTSVLAAGESLGATLGATSFADIVALLILSGVSGLVALLHRVRRSMEAAAVNDLAGKQQIDWRVFAGCHMAGAMFMGLMMFFICEAGDLNNYLEAALISLASWSGAKLADRLADGLGDGLLARLGAALNTPPKG